MVSASLMPAGEANTLSAAAPAGPRDARPVPRALRAARPGAELPQQRRSSLSCAALLLARRERAAGYAFAKLRFPAREPLFAVLLAALVIPAQVAMLPLFLLLRSMGLVNSYAGVILPGIASIFGIFLVRQYALSVPDELLDAARDRRRGRAADLLVDRPAALPARSSSRSASSRSSATWNDFMWPLIVLTDDTK